MAVDLADAVLEALRSSGCAALFGDTWQPDGSGVMKFFGDFAGATAPAYPYLVCQEVGETYEYMTYGPGNYVPFIATGTLQVAVYADDRALARRLGLQVGLALNDAALAWPECTNFMMLRLAGASFVPVTSEGVAVPSVFLRMLTFQYQYQGYIEP